MNTGQRLSTEQNGSTRPGTAGCGLGQMERGCPVPGIGREEVDKHKSTEKINE